MLAFTSFGWFFKIGEDNMIKNEIEFIKDLAILINKYNRESISRTPDFILAEYLNGCLNNFEVIVNTRAAWYSENQNFKEKQE